MLVFTIITTVIGVIAIGTMTGIVVKEEILDRLEDAKLDKEIKASGK